MDDKKRAAIKRIWQAQDDNHELSVFWQDHFYTSGTRFGYPVCVQLLNTLTDQVEDFVIIDYYTYEATCESVLKIVEQYLFELDAEKLERS